MNASKAITAAVTAVVTGAGFVVSAGVLHGTTLVLVEAGIAMVDVAASSYGVYLTSNTKPLPGPTT